LGIVRFMTIAGRLVCVATAIAVFAGCSSQPSGETAAETPTGATHTASADAVAPQGRTSSSAVSGSALALLATLAVKGRATMNTYERSLFGDAWTDDNESPGGHNGCDTRNDILRRDLINVALKPHTQGCVVLTGTLRDPYLGTAIGFTRGPQTSAEVQIDHVVALGDAWQTGAQSWDAATRTELANDPLNLLAVDGPSNMQKGDSDAASWLPKNKSYRCSYVARQIAVKKRYGLWVTRAEHDAMARVLSTCPTMSAPQESPAAKVGASSHSSAPTSQAPTPTSAASVYYANCSDARAAGAAPLRRGDPGYRAGLDRDGDGVACE
jgi:hypothetical protein